MAKKGLKKMIPFLGGEMKLEDLDEKLIKAKVEPMSACEEIGGTMSEGEDGNMYCYLRRLRHPEKPEVVVSPLEVLEKKRRPSKPEV